MDQLRRYNDHRFPIQVRRFHRRAFNLLELLVVIVILALLLAVLLPSLKKAKIQSRRMMCASNLRQWGVAAQMYRDENHDYLPTEGTFLDIHKTYTWFTVLPEYLNLPPYPEFERKGNQIVELPNIHMWICPEKVLTPLYKSQSGLNQFHYAINRVLDGTGKNDGGNETPEFPDEGDEPIAARRYQKRNHQTVFMFDIAPNMMHGGPREVGGHHDTFANVLFLSGAVAPFRIDRFVTDGDWEDGDIIWDDPELYWGYKPKKKRRR